MSKRFNRLRDRIRKRTKRERVPEKNFDFQALPNDIKQRVSSFLHVQVTLNLLLACKSMSDDLGLSRALFPLSRPSSAKNISVLSFRKLNHSMSIIASIVPTESNELHSITFQSDWVDQGMGRRKGQLCVVAQKKSSAGKLQQYLPFEQGRVVCKSSMATSDLSNVVASFHPLPNEYYQIWCYVGNEYGDLIHFRNMNVHVLSFGSCVQSCPIQRYKFSYQEDEDTHMKRKSIRFMEYMLFKGPLVAD
jgi:hypothetical protein